MEVVVEIVESGQPVKRYEKLDSNRITIGRGWDNDVIVSDPDVDAQHVVLVFDSSVSGYYDDGFSVVDCDSANGTRVNKAVIAEDSRACGFGDSIHLGQTVIKVHRPMDAVAPVRIQSSRRFPLCYFDNLSVVVVLALLAVLFDPVKATYLEPSDFDWIQLLRDALSVGLSLLVVALCLGALSKLIKGNFIFWPHVGLISAVILIGGFATPLLSWFSFNLLSSFINSILEILLPSVLLVLWLLPTLYLCTDFTVKRRRIFTGFAVAIFAAFGFVFPLLQENDYSWGYNSPDLVSINLAPRWLVATEISRDEFLSRALTTFEAAEQAVAEELDSE